jgi:hypothetical protein
VKHRFLLDENVLYHAIRGVDRHNNFDLTCTELLVRISRNCHKIIVSTFLWQRYTVRVNALKQHRPGVLQPAFVLGELIYNSAKFVAEYNNPPQLPASCHIPAEDVDIVRAAMT